MIVSTSPPDFPSSSVAFFKRSNSFLKPSIDDALLILFKFNFSVVNLSFNLLYSDDAFCCSTNVPLIDDLTSPFVATVILPNKETDLYDVSNIFTLSSFTSVNCVNKDISSTNNFFFCSNVISDKLLASASFFALFSFLFICSSYFFRTSSINFNCKLVDAFFFLSVSSVSLSSLSLITFLVSLDSTVFLSRKVIEAIADDVALLDKSNNSE